MDSDLRDNLANLVVITIIGIATGAFGLTMVRNSAATLDVGTFSTLIIVIPCAVMVLGSFAVTLVAPRIGRQLFIATIGICLATGIVAMAVTSSWTADPQITEQLLANSPEGSVIYPILQAPVIVLRDVAAFVVCPTVGSIAGAWLGSRLHPVEATRRKGGKSKAKRR